MGLLNLVEASFFISLVIYINEGIGYEVGLGFYFEKEFLFDDKSDVYIGTMLKKGKEQALEKIIKSKVISGESVHGFPLKLISR